MRKPDAGKPHVRFGGGRGQRCYPPTLSDGLNDHCTPIIASAVIALAVLGYVGLQVRPRSFAPYAPSPAEPRMVSLPGDLPPPVARFCRTAVGDHVPVIDSAVLSGRGQARLKGVRLPA